MWGVRLQKSTFLCGNEKENLAGKNREFAGGKSSQGPALCKAGLPLGRVMGQRTASAHKCCWQKGTARSSKTWRRMLSAQDTAFHMLGIKQLICSSPPTVPNKKGICWSIGWGTETGTTGPYEANPWDLTCQLAQNSGLNSLLLQCAFLGLCDINMKIPLPPCISKGKNQPKKTPRNGEKNPSTVST